MKILTLWKLALIVGKPKEIAEIRKLTRGYHVHKDPVRKVSGGKP